MTTDEELTHLKAKLRAYEGILDSASRNACELEEKLKQMDSENKQLREKFKTHPLHNEMAKLVESFNAANVAQVKPEPSRLEIAAMLLNAAMLVTGRLTGHAYSALNEADALIAAAKEVR